jgi:transcriptional antiterminator RfaH
MSAHWYVVHTQPNGEARADEQLRRQGYATFLPFFLKRRRHARKTDTVRRPLFPRYMFVSIDTDSQGWHAIRSTRGVSALVGGSEGPVPVREEIIEALRAQIGTDGFFGTQPPPFMPGQAIRVIDGVFASAVGFFERMSDNERVSMLLELLGQRVRVTLDLNSVATV